MHDWGFSWGLGVVILVAVLINWFIDRRDSPKMSIPTARDILDKRSANGEIGRDEYALEANSLHRQ
jgi:uncharacterized membrane protein